MNKKSKYKLLAWTMTAALTLTASPSTGMMASAKSSSSVSTKWYTISKKPGTYQKKVTLKVTAKKGFQVYYTTNGKFRLKKKLNSGKSTRITISKTTKLSVYAVRKSKKITAKQLNSKNTKKKTSYKNYYYKIAASTSDSVTSATASAAPGTTASPTASAVPNNTARPSASADTSAAPNNTARPSASAVPNNTTSPAASADTSSAPDTTTSPAASADASSEPTSTVTPVPVPTVSPVSSLPADYDESTSQTIQISSSGITTSNLKSESSVTCETDETSGITEITISEAGTYVLSGGTEEPLTDTGITIKKNTGEVNLIWDNLHIDNSALGGSAGQDSAVFQIKSGDKTTNQVTVFLKGENVLTGNGSVYTETTDGATTTSLPGGVIEAKGADTVLTFASYDETDIGSLSVTDAMDTDTTDYGSEDPSDGISSKGTLIIQSGKFEVSSNGDCLKGTGSDGNGGMRFASANTSDSSTAPGSTSKGAPGGNGGPDGNGGSSGSTYSANTAFSIADSSGNVILSICPNKSYSYVLYSSPELTSSDSYTLYSGGSVSGNKLTDSDYDFRYEGCDTSSASVISTTTAGTTVQGGNSRP